MRPLTDHPPKPLLQAGGKALIVWHVERLARAGITDIIINHAHLGEQIEAALGDGSRFGVHLLYSAEGKALETAGGIAHALPLLGKAPFAVINGDIWCDYDFSFLPERAAALQASDDAAHLVLVDNPPQHPNGDFALKGNRILFSAPSPQPSPASGRGSNIAAGKEGLSAKLTFSGIGIYQPMLFADIPRGGVAPLAPLLRTQIALDKVSGEHYRGPWTDVGTPQRLAELDIRIRSSQNAAHA